MGAAIDSLWSFIQQRTDTAYLFVASLLTLATGYGSISLANELSPDRSISTLSPTLRSFDAASEWLSGDQWSWIGETSQWLTERSEVLHPVAVLLLWGAGVVIALQGRSSLNTKASATLLLAWVLVVNTGGMSLGNWVGLLGLFIGFSLKHAKDGDWRCWKGETLTAFAGVILAPWYGLIFVVAWLIGKTRTNEVGAVTQDN